MIAGAAVIGIVEDSGILRCGAAIVGGCFNDGIEVGCRANAGATIRACGADMSAFPAVG